MSRSRTGYTSPSFTRNSDREGFEHLMNRGDATIDIPLQNRPNNNTNGAMNEKQSYFQRRGIRKSVVFEQQKAHARNGYYGEEDTITKMGQIYDKILNFSVFTRYFLYIIPVAAIIAIPIIVGATSATTAEIGQVQLTWVFVWVLCSWVGLWVSKVVAHYLPVVFQTICGTVSSGTRKYALILKQLEIPLSLVGWALVTLATFKPLMTRNPESREKQARKPDGWPIPDWINIVQQILAAAMISSLIFTGERVFIQIITINYHRKQFHSRIREAKRRQDLLALLYDASRGMFPTFCEEFQEEDAIIEDTLDLFRGAGNKKKGHSRSGSSTPMRMLQEVGDIGSKLTSALGNVAQEVTGKQLRAPHNSAHTIIAKALQKNRASEALARRLWLSFVIEGNDALHLDDLIEVLGPGRQAEAEESFSMLDQDSNGDVSLDEMILTISQFGRDKHSIGTSMHDVDQAIKVLDRMLCVVMFIIVVFIFVAFLNHSFVTTLATAGTALLSLSFVFSATAAEFLGSCIFLFVKHPFDIGDRVDLNTGTDKMIVEHISLLFTVFRRIDSHRTVQIPNMVLNTLWIENVSRSNAMKERLSMFVAFDTTLEDIQLLRNEMKKFVTANENKRDFQDDITIEVIGISEMNKLELSIEIQHKSNWSNETVRAARRSKFMCALVLAIRKVPIYGAGSGDPAQGSSGNPSYSVTVSDAEAATARDMASRDKEAKRLLPTKKAPETEKLADTLGSSSELRVMTSLNERSPAFDDARDAGGLRGGSATSPISPKMSTTSKFNAAGEQDEDEMRGIIRRSTTNVGRRKSNRTGAGEGLGTGHSAASSTVVDTVDSRTDAPAVPPIGVTVTAPQRGMPPTHPARLSQGSEDEEWFGQERRYPTQHSSYEPSNPQMGTWRGT